MVYTEIKKVKGKKYYYRVKSVRKGKKIEKERKYLGVDLVKKELVKKEKEADKELVLFSNLLTEDELKQLNMIKQNYLKESKDNIESKYESFCSLFTYDSTGIEGNTLTLQETAQLLFENRVPSAKSLREINESLNHKEAFDYILNYKGDISKSFILNLHKLIAKNTLKQELQNQIGKYRKLQVYIRGVNWLPSKPEEVPREMKNLLSWYSKNKNKNKLHPLIISAYFHAGFETVHPFVDGNGRVGRLLMNFILHKNKLPMINIPNSKKHIYYNTLEKAQVEGDLRQLIIFLLDLLNEEKIKF